MRIFILLSIILTTVAAISNPCDQIIDIDGAHAHLIGMSPIKLYIFYVCSRHYLIFQANVDHLYRSLRRPLILKFYLISYFEGHFSEHLPSWFDFALHCLAQEIY